MYTASSSYSFDWGGGEETEKTQFPFSVASAFQNANASWKDVGSFPLFRPPLTILLFPPLADMLSWVVWCKFLPNKVIANTCLFFFQLAPASSQLLGRYLRFVNCVHCLLTRQRRIQWINTCTLVAAATASTGGGKKRKRSNFPFLLHQPSKMETLHENMLGLFRYFVPAPLTKLLSPLADMLSWAVWFKFLPNKVIANTCLFILTSFSKQSASWKVPEICDLWALSTDSPKTYSVNKYMYTASSSYSFDWGGGRNGKDPISLFCCISLPKWKHYMRGCLVFSVHVQW